jgi:broad specificity phosphatase PhoE
MECHLGDHQGHPHGTWLPEYFRGNYMPPNGEHFEDFCTRTWEAMQRAVARGPNTLIVAHGGLWVSARRYVAVDPDLAKMPNALPLYVEPEPGSWRHRIVGDLEWGDSPVTV